MYVPLLVGFLTALVVVPAVVKGFYAEGHTAPNYRDVKTAFPVGVAIVATVVCALAVLALLDRAGVTDELVSQPRSVLVYILGVAFLGLVDDLLGGKPRGWRGHGSALLGGYLTTGVLKAVGALGLALYSLTGLGYSTGEFLVAVSILVLATNLFNLLDLRPGRCVKFFFTAVVLISVLTWTLEPVHSLGIFIGPVLFVGVYDLQERGMLGDVGSNLIGGLVGFWCIATLTFTGQLIALALLLIVTIYGEFSSITKLIEKTPPLRWLDSVLTYRHRP